MADTTITGPTAVLTIDGNHLGAVFNIPTPSISVTFSHLVIKGGSDDGILCTGNNSNVVVSSATVSGNTGNGINTWFGNTTLTNVVVSGNTNGGVVNGSGKLTLNNVDVSGNLGYGISNPTDPPGTCLLTDVSVSGNKGYGIYNVGSLSATNVTVSGNAGGISNGLGAATLTNVTISGNISDKGGGILIGNSSTVTLANSIVAGNTAAVDPDASGSFSSLGYNLIGKTDGSSGWNASDLLGTVAHPLSAKLAALGDNGGPTRTMLPLTGSPAINHGWNAVIPSGIKTDQRGLPRIVNGTVDIGAVEVQQSPATGSISGTAFSDTNANSKLDTGEKLLANVKLYLDANKNGVLDSGETTITTNGLGAFTFTKLPAATYRVREVLPVGYAMTAPTLGYYDVAVTAGANVTGKLFADAPATASIAGRVYNDADGDGLADHGEAGLGLWKVYIDLNNNGVFDGKDVSVTTDIFGNWSFKNLTAGTYTVRVVPVSGLVPTKPTGGALTIKLTAGQASGGNLFGERVPT